MKRLFSKADSTNWSYVLYKITEVIDDTIPSYKSNNYPERYNEDSITKISTILFLKNNKVMNLMKVFSILSYW